VDAIDLPIRPTFDGSSIDKAISKLKELEAKGFTIPVNFVGNLEALKTDAEAVITKLRGQWMGLSSDLSAGNNKLLQELDRLGESGAAARLRKGFASVREEVLVLDNLISQLGLKGDPGAGLAKGLAAGRLADIVKSGQAAGENVSFAGYGEQAERATVAQEKFTQAEAKGVGTARQSEEALAAESGALKAKAVQFEEARAAAAKFQAAEQQMTAQAQRSTTATVGGSGSAEALQRQRSAALIAAGNSEVALQRQRSAALLTEQRRAAQEEAAEAKRQQTAREALQRQRSQALIRQAKEDERAAATGGFRGVLNTVGTASTFIATYGAIDFAVRGLKAGAEASVEFERKLATLSVIFRGTKEESRELALATVNVAAGFGQDGIAALEVAKDFARFGGTAADVLEAVRVVSMAANVAEIDLAQTSKFFQAIMAGGALQTGQLAGVLGMLNTASNTTNVTVLQLLEGLARVAPLAKQAGVGLAEMIGFETAINAKTSRPGAEAGNALKSLFARFEKPQVQGALGSVGIDVKDQSGQLKTASQLINELAVQYLKLEGAERTELVVKVAGTQQASRIAALLDGYVQSQEVAIRVSRDLTSSDRENVAVRETLSSQLGTLKTRWEQFWIAGAGAGAAGGAQGALTDIVKLFSNLLSIMTSVETSLGAVVSAAGKAVKATLGDRAGGAVTESFSRTVNPIYGFNKSFEDVKVAAKNAGVGDVFKSDAETAAEGLAAFNSQVDKLQKLGEADEAAQRLLKTISSLAKNASADERESMFRSVAAVTSPDDLKKQQALREELSALAKAGDFIGLNNRLTAIGADLGADRLKQLQLANAEFDKEIAKQTDLIAKGKAQRDIEEQRNDKAGAAKSTVGIEQAEAARQALLARKTGVLAQQFNQGEDPEIEIAKKQADKLAKILTNRPKTTQLADRDKEAEALALTNALQDKNIAQLDEIEKKYSLIVDMQRRSISAINDTVAAYGEVSKVIPSINRTDELTGDMRLIDLKDQLLQQEKAMEIPKLRALGLSEQEIAAAAANIDAQRQLLQVDRERTAEQIRFAAAVDAAKQGVRDAQATNDFTGGVGRNETEKKGNLIRGLTGPDAARDSLTGLPLNIAAAQNDFSSAKNPVDQAQALARLKEFGISLQAAENDLVRHRFQLEAEITNERRKQAEEASKNLLMAGREDQLRAALAAKFAAQRGGKGFSANEFQFFDPSTKQAIEKTNPDLLPPEFKNRLRELTDESASLRLSFVPLRDSAETAAKALAALQLPTAGVSPPGLNLPAGVDFSQVGGAIDQSGHAVQTAIEVLANSVTGHFDSFAGALSDLSSTIDARMARLERGSGTAGIGRAQGAASVLA
jgi:TP901 family phage tail tape measure protein